MTTDCDYCDSGYIPKYDTEQHDWYHLIEDDEGIEGTARVPCARGGDNAAEYILEKYVE